MMRYGDWFSHPVNGDPLMFCGYSYTRPERVWCVRYWRDGNGRRALLYLCDAVLLQERTIAPPDDVPTWARRFQTIRARMAWAA